MPLFQTIDESIPAIQDSLQKHHCAVLTAPPGAGKSTRIPLAFIDAATAQKPVIVLQPRRLATRSLAVYLSKQLQQPPGTTIGWRVKGESRVTNTTKLVFETTGLFLRQTLLDPLFTGCSLMILDEFHERTLEADLILAWLLHLRKNAIATPPFVIMSATIDAEALTSNLGIDEPVVIQQRVHPITRSYMPLEAGEKLTSATIRAVRSLHMPSMKSSILVFMPGKGEIKNAAETLSLTLPSLPVYQLHGSLTIEEQSSVLAAPSQGPCVIVTTNVAETSLTIPGIRAVIDSGFERRASYDATRDRNTLVETRISLASAQQRAGRAGRQARRHRDRG